MVRERQKKDSMGKEEEEEELVLEINLISAQGLKPPSGNLRKMHSYAVVWVDPSTKLRTRIDRVGAENPTWNDKFLFRVSSGFIASETSGVVVEIYAVGYIRDYLVGTVRLLISSCGLEKSTTSSEIGTPAFTAVQIRRPSGRFQGVLNLAASISSAKSSDLEIFNGSFGISFGDIAGHWAKKEKDESRRRRRLSRIGSKGSSLSFGGETIEFDISSLDLSDGTESTGTAASISSTCPSPVVPPNTLKEWNGGGLQMAGGLKELNSAEVAGTGGGTLCGLILQRRIPSNQNLRFWDDKY